MERELPLLRIYETDFIVDVKKLELREKGNERNKISFEDLYNVKDGYMINYDLKEKNVPSILSQNEVISVHIPEFVKLDPLGMSQKHNLTLDELKGKTDFDLLVNQEAYDMRVNKGLLPTIDIEGHIFYVDIRMDKLRPKDDFLSNGISLTDIENYFDEERRLYIIPYDPIKREFQGINYETILEIPRNLTVVSFPHEAELDPIGWNRNENIEPLRGLIHRDLKNHFTAKPAKWEDIYVPQKIKENLQALKERKEKNKIIDFKDRTKNDKGRKM